MSLIGAEDMVWRKYAVEEWGALLPHHSPHEQQRLGTTPGAPLVNWTWFDNDILDQITTGS